MGRTAFFPYLISQTSLQYLHMQIQDFSRVGDWYLGVPESNGHAPKT